MNLRHRPVRGGHLAAVPDQGALRRADPHPHLQQHAAGRENNGDFGRNETQLHQVVVLSFMFTSCPDLCPLTTARLTQVEDKLGDALGREVFLVSLSIDPENDTPAKLKAYAQTFGTGPAGPS